MEVATGLTRRRLLSGAAFAAGATLTSAPHILRASEQAIDALDSRSGKIVRATIGIDTHNHIDVPLTAPEMPGPDIDLAGEMKQSGLSAICMTFATDYQQGDAYDRFHNALASIDKQLQRNGMKRSLTAADVRGAHARQHPTVIQAIEGAHFLQGHLERVAEAYEHGLRHFGLLHDSDASVPLGDVYTNGPRYGGLTDFGARVIRECNRLGMLIDLAHADTQATGMALKITTRPVVVSHTGLNTQLGSNPRIAQMMMPRLISREQAKMIAGAGGAVGVWTHLSDTPLEYARNIRALVDVIGVDHVMIGTDTKLTPPSPRPPGPPPNGFAGAGPRPSGPGPQPPRIGERTNMAWPEEKDGFYFVVVDAMLKTGFTQDEIAKIGGGNYLRIFEQSMK